MACGEPTNEGIVHDACLPDYPWCLNCVDDYFQINCVATAKVQFSNFNYCDIIILFVGAMNEQPLEAISTIDGDILDQSVVAANNDLDCQDNSVSIGL